MAYYNRKVQFLEWDTNHFGFKIGRFGPQEDFDVKEAVEQACSHGIEMLMARCDTDNVSVNHSLQNAGFLLMDTFVRYHFVFGKKEIPVETGLVPIRPFRPKDVPDIGAVARASFEGYFGHFHNDPRFERDKCDSLYEEWAVNSCREKHLADEVLVADHKGEILGFVTLKGLNEEAVEFILAGIAPEAQGMGIYRSCLVKAMHWCQDHGFHKVEMNSQVYHYAVQRVWQRLGFEIYASGHTFHLWLDEIDNEE